MQKSNQPVLARVVGEERGAYRLELESGGGDPVWGEVTGKFRHEAVGRLSFPGVGDWVECSWAPGQTRAQIHAVRDRKSCLVRRAPGTAGEDQLLAANVDVAFLVTSANGDLNPRRLERYLALAWDGGARPVILLTKAELAGEAVSERVAEIEAVAIGVEVHAVSVWAGTGLEVFDKHLVSGATAVLLGSSGVGKSTIANYLLGREAMQTQAIREDDARGRHTTTSRHLFRLASGAALIDTPGMRELQLGVDAEQGLDAAFSDIEALAASCRFTDCGHDSEPGCALRAALESGELAQERWESYGKLQRELAFEERKRDSAAASRTKERWKKIHEQARQHTKRKRWDGL